MEHRGGTEGGVRGLTLVELIIVMTLLVVLSGAIFGVLLRTERAQVFAETDTSLTGAGQDILEAIRGDVGRAFRLFVAGTEGAAYLSGLDRSSAPPLGNSRLPVLDTSLLFEKDIAGGETAGNLLLMAVHDRTDVFDLTGSGELRRTNVYRLVVWYLRPIPGSDPGKRIGSLDFVRWVSVPLADRNQVEEISDPGQRTALLVHLFNGDNPQDPALPFPPVRHLWRPGDPFPSAFLVVDSGGTTNAVPPGFELAMDPKRTRNGLLAHRGLAVASNLAGEEHGIARWSIRSDTGSGFPHGFESKILGPASARQVLLHFVLVSRRGEVPSELRNWADFQGLAETRDL